MSRLNKKDYIAKYGEEAWAIETKRRNKQKKEYLKNNPEKALLRDNYFKEYRKNNKEKHKEYCKQYYADNKDSIKFCKQEYYNTNKEIIKQHGKEYYEANKQAILKKRKQYRDENKEKVRQSNKAWRENNTEYIKAKQKEYCQSKHGRAVHLYLGYKHFDMNNGFTCQTTPDWIIDNIFTSSCVYCGESDWRKLGCDRIDNEKAHTPENCVCACKKCNKERSDRYTVEEFILIKRAG